MRPKAMRPEALVALPVALSLAMLPFAHAQLIKVPEAYRLFKELITYYGITQLIEFIEQSKITDWRKLAGRLPEKPLRTAWKNIGGQLIPEPRL